MAELNDIEIPLADIRVLVVQLMKDGNSEIPLGDFLLMLRDIYRKYKKG